MLSQCETVWWLYLRILVCRVIFLICSKRSSLRNNGQLSRTGEVCPSSSVAGHNVVCASPQGRKAHDGRLPVAYIDSLTSQRRKLRS